MILNDDDLSITVSEEVVRSLLDAPPDVEEDVEDGNAAPARGPRRRAEAITPLPRAPNRRVRSGPPWGMTSEIFFPAPLGDLHASARTCTIASFALCPARLATNEES